VSTSRQTERWFLEFRHPLFRYLRTIGCRPSLVEEIAHETFFRLHRTLRDGVQVKDARAWLFRVARNLWIDSRRDRRRFLAPEHEEQWQISPAADPERQAIWRQRIQIVASEAAQLPQLERQCLRLKAEGLRYREIAIALGIPMSTAVECVRRAVKLIRRRLAESEGAHRSWRGAP
jgi:RNA polymerase sigma-70 factor, ECF subfamily